MSSLCVVLSSVCMSCFDEKTMFLTISPKIANWTLLIFLFYEVNFIFVRLKCPSQPHHFCYPELVLSTVVCYCCYLCFSEFIFCENIQYEGRQKICSCHLIWSFTKSDIQICLFFKRALLLGGDQSDHSRPSTTQCQAGPVVAIWWTEPEHPEVVTNEVWLSAVV